MKFKIVVRKPDGEEWSESYDKPIGLTTEEWCEYHPDNRLRGRKLKAVEEWGRALIYWFNATRRQWESEREFVSCEFIKEYEKNQEEDDE